MAASCVIDVAFRRAFRECLTQKDRLRVLMRVGELLGDVRPSGCLPAFTPEAMQSAREKWAKELPDMLAI